MNLQKKLQNIGIEQIAKINPEFVRLIAFNVTEALTAHYNKSYVSSSATGTDTVAEAIVAGINDSIKDGKAVSDTQVLAVSTAAAADDADSEGGKKVTGNVTLTYNGKSKIGTVTNSGISWAGITDATK